MSWMEGKLERAGREPNSHQSQPRKHNPERQTQLDEYQSLAPLVARLDSLVPRQPRKQNRGNLDSNSQSEPHLRNVLRESLSVLNHKAARPSAPFDKDATNGIRTTDLTHKSVQEPKTGDNSHTARSKEIAEVPQGDRDPALDSKIKKILEKPDWVGIKLAQEFAQVYARSKTQKKPTAVINKDFIPPYKRRKRSPLLKQTTQNLDFEDRLCSLNGLYEESRACPSTNVADESIEAPTSRLFSAEESSEAEDTSPALQHKQFTCNQNSTPLSLDSTEDIELERVAVESTDRTSDSVSDSESSVQDDVIHEKENISKSSGPGDSVNEIWKAFVFGDHQSKIGKHVGQPSKHPKRSRIKAFEDTWMNSDSSPLMRKPAGKQKSKLSKGNALPSVASDFSLDRPSSVANASTAPTVLFTCK